MFWYVVRYAGKMRCLAVRTTRSRALWYLLVLLYLKHFATPSRANLAGKLHIVVFTFCRYKIEVVRTA